MIDIATRALTSEFSTRPPFDWALAETDRAETITTRNYLQPCKGVSERATLIHAYALAGEDTLKTAVIISLFTDQRAGDDDILPAGETDRRGWVGEEWYGGEAWGSKLWLLYFSKRDATIPARAKFYAESSLAWMIRDGVASRIVCAAAWAQTGKTEVLTLRPQIWQGDDPSPVYDVLWGTTIDRINGGAV